MSDSGAHSEAVGQLPFGLSQPPFADETTDANFFRSDQHLRALEFLGHVLWSRESFGVLFAESGCGKTLITRRFLARLDERILPVQINHERLGPQDFLGEVLRQLGIRLEPVDRTDRRRLLERFLTHQTSFGRICVLLVENAQAMPVRTLDELRQIAALEVDGARVLKVILTGDSTLERIVDSPAMSSVNRGAAAPRFVLNAFSEDQLAAYIAHRLKAVDVAAPDQLIPPTVMADIHHASGGVPAVINDICSRALAYAAAAGLPAVTQEVVRQAITSLDLQQPWRSSLAVPRPQDVADNAIDDVREIVLTLALQGAAPREISLASNKILIGRSELADVCIDSAYVSRYHALIVREAGRDLLIDLGSTNAVLVNARRIVRHFLQPNDLIQIGPARLNYANRSSIAIEADPGMTVSMMGPVFPSQERPRTGIVVSIGSST